MKLEISKMLTLSTSHIKKETSNDLDHGNGVDIVYFKKDDYGYFIYVGEEVQSIVDYTETYDDLRMIMLFAYSVGCTWICLDCDAETIDALKTYEWE